MTDNVITYEALYEILRKEKFNSELQKLNPSFFKDVVKYLEEKASIIEAQKDNSGSVFASAEAKKINFQLANVKKIIKEIYDIRENKINQMASSASKLQSKQDTSEMLEEEKQLFNKLLTQYNNFREDVLEAVLSSKLPKIREESQPKPLKAVYTEPNQESNGLTTIRFKESVPKFVGENLQTYGPFEKEDVSHIPSKIANLLIQTNRAEQINENT